MWTKELTFQPGNDWLCSEPTDAEYFQFRSLNPPDFARYLVAQVEFTEINLRIADIRELAATSDYLVLHIPKSPVLDQRRIAVIQASNYQAKSWGIELWSSDYVTPQSSTSGSSSAVNLTYNFNGDANGVLYWAGTARGTSPWQNPHVAGFVEISQSSAYDSTHQAPQLLCDRQASTYPGTANIPNSYFRINLKTFKLIPNYYTLRGRDYFANHLRSWQLVGSNDLQTWDVLDQQQNNTVINQNTWFGGAVVASKAYKFFDVVMTGASSTGDNILTLGEIELYGKVVI
jgi:hypothetical protein